MRSHEEALELLGTRGAAAAGHPEGVHEGEVRIGPAIVVRRVIYDLVPASQIDDVLDGLRGDVESVLELFRLAMYRAFNADAPEIREADGEWQDWLQEFDVDRVRRGLYSFLGHEVAYGLLLAHADKQMDEAARA